MLFRNFESFTRQQDPKLVFLGKHLPANNPNISMPRMMGGIPPYHYKFRTGEVATDAVIMPEGWRAVFYVDGEGDDMHVIALVETFQGTAEREIHAPEEFIDFLGEIRKGQVELF